MKKTYYYFLTFIIIIILIPFILYFCCKLYNNTYHHFWSTQPVSFFYTFKIKDGIISDKRPPKPIKNNNYNLQRFTSDDEKLEEIISLLNNNYSTTDNCTYHYDNDYGKWIFKSEHGEKLNLYLSENSKIIGCITSRSTTLTVNGNKLRCLYVDNLCIDKNYRQKGIAPILISHMSNSGYDMGYNLFIYQKEGHQLPYKSIALNENTIYELIKYNLGDYKLEELNDSNLKQVHDFFNNYFKGKDNYLEFSFTEFCHYFKNNWTKTYLEFKNNQIINLIVTCNANYQIEKKPVIEIPYMLITEDPQIIFVQKVFNQCFLDGFRLICNKSKKNQHMFLNLKAKNTFTSFIYMYNYHIMRPLTNHHLVFF